MMETYTRYNDWEFRVFIAEGRGYAEALPKTRGAWRKVRPTVSREEPGLWCLCAGKPVKVAGLHAVLEAAYRTLIAGDEAQPVEFAPPVASSTVKTD